MSANRLFNVLVALALVVVIALTAHAGIATSRVVSSQKVVFDQRERHPAYATPRVASAAPAFDVERARIGWRAGAVMAFIKRQDPAGYAPDQQKREVIQARWLARYGGTHRTCVLLCGER